MKKHFYASGIIAIILSMLSSLSASAQYYEIANRIPSLIQPALSGSGQYKGFIEAGYSKTLGNYDADFLELSTSQGFQYNSWFYMGVGLGVDVLFSHKNDDWGSDWENPSYGSDRGSTTTAAMIPLFTDFRFNIGGNSGASFFIDMKVGCSFLLGNKYISIGDGYLTNQEYFYLRPSIGMRIPTNSRNPKQAVDIGINYRLLTSNYWNSWSRNITLNSIGVSLAFEW
ncbi:hypothetical protein [Lepagella muris]|jgi:hypothetical protein|uniref:Uncharacterized protein n=1 Tax=Lepagella muris TaxID=3032870 RepID=A0AC61REP8_9BACT|nr:hypothetical protein [Lepagella muris]ROT05581.1 hypothetical protein EEL33_11660 [Muribaculaceae bacterium Isolate-037 (Harlan)]TGY78026.1 hypothetical protein E5331_11785 [Lepagella muris]THG51629.1 hypothetical protein E5984_10860 [Bacteroidales bacterium]TKC63241.1 hypothetical protein E5359_003825 [Bacteroidales bacterium]